MVVALNYSLCSHLLVSMKTWHKFHWNQTMQISVGKSNYFENNFHHTFFPTVSGLGILTHGNHKAYLDRNRWRYLELYCLFWKRFEYVYFYLLILHVIFLLNVDLCGFVGAKRYPKFFTPISMKLCKHLFFSQGSTVFIGERRILFSNSQYYIDIHNSHHNNITCIFRVTPLNSKSQSH